MDHSSCRSDRKPLWRSRRLALFSSALAVLAMPARAETQLISCAAVTDLDHQAAVAAADGWFTARWAKAGRAWSTAYLVPSLKPAPLGLNRLSGGDSAELLMAPAPPITGLAAAMTVSCTTLRAETGPSYAVHYTARSLRFTEGKGWSTPLDVALLHALTVEPAKEPSRWTVSETPDAPIAMLPGAKLSQPMKADVALLGTSKNQPASQNRPAPRR